MDAILDASAIVALLRNERGAADLEAICDDAANAISLLTVNATEAYYVITRKVGQARAWRTLEPFVSGVLLIDTVGDGVWQHAAELKATYSLPLGDALLAAVAADRDLTVVTGDHSDFEALAQDGVCAVHFIR